jgi:PAS domain S-box-containing protein
VAHFDVRWQSPETLQAIFNQISDAVLFYNKDLHLVGVNKSGEKLFGLTGDEMLGRSCWSLFHVAAAEQNGDPRSDSDWLPTGTLTLLREDGQERRVVIRSIELLDEAGRLEGVVSTITDLTGQLTDPTPQDNGPRQSADKYHPIVIRNRRVAAVLAGLLLLLIMVVAGTIFFAPGKQYSPEQKHLVAAEKEKREAATRFSAMTAAQHIEMAKLALRPGATSDVIAEGQRHLRAIPASAPEAALGKNLQRDLSKAGSLRSAQNLIDAAANAEVRDGMDKLQRASLIIDSVTRQYPNDPGAAQLTRAIKSTVEQLAVRFPQEFAVAETKLVDFTWEKGGFGTVMIGNFTIRNDSPVDVADFKIRCQQYDQNGVVLDQNAGTAFGVAKAHSTIRIPNINMGFLSAQSGTSRTTKTDCEILGLKLASESQSATSAR